MNNYNRRARRRGTAALALAALAVVSAPKAADGGTKFWKNSVVSGSWNTASNWSATGVTGVDNAGVPVAGDTVNIANTDGTARTITYNYTGAALSLGSLFVDQTGAGSTFDVLSMTANALTVAGDERLGSSGRGSMSQSGGVNTIGGQLALGSSVGSTGAYALSNGAYLFAQSGETIGGLGAGTFTQSGATVPFNEPNDFVALNNAASLYSLSAGYLYLTGAGSTEAELLNAGTFNQTGGTHVIGNQAINYTLRIGAMAGQTGTFNLTGGGTTVDGDAYVGGFTSAGGTGILKVQGGTMTILGDLKIWNTTGSIVNLGTGGTLSADSIDTSSNTSLFNWTAGTLNITGAGGLGLGTASATRPLGNTLSLTSTRTLSVTNALTIDPSASFTLTTGTLTVGSVANSGTFNWNGGTIAVTGSSGVTLGGAAPFGSSVNIDTNHPLKVTNALTIPAATSLSLNSGTLTVGSIASNGTFNWNGGAIAVTGDAGVTLGGTSPFGSSVTVDSSHTLTVNNTLTIPAATTLNLASGTLTVGAIAPAGTFNWTGGTLAITGPGTNLTSLAVGGASGETLNQTGGNATTANLTIGASAGTTGTLTLSSSTAAVFTDNGSAYVGGSSSSAGGTGTLSVQTGSAMTIAGALKVWNTAGSIVNLATGGSLSVGALDTTSTPAGFNWTGGAFSVTGAGGLGLGAVSATRPLGPTLTMTSSRTLSVTNALTIDSGAAFTLSSGTLTVGSIVNNNAAGGFTWTAGTINVTGAAGVTLGSTAPFGSTVTVDGAHLLNVTNALTIPAGITLNLSATNATLSAGFLVNNGTFNWTSGTFTQTGSGALPFSTVQSTGAFTMSAGSGNITVTPPGGAGTPLANNSAQFIMDSPTGAHDVTFAGNLSNVGNLRVRGGGGGARVIVGNVDNFGLVVFNNADGTPLTVNSLTMETGSQDWVNLGSPGFTNTINVLNSNGLTFAGTVTVNLSNARNDGNQGYGAGTYPLFHYSGTSALPTFATTLSSGTPSGFSYSYINDPASGNVYLDVIPSTGQSWTGSIDATWNNANWSGTGTTAPSSTQLATFPSSIPASGSTITLGSGETSNGLLFNNSYTLTGGSLALSNGMVDVVGGKTVTIATTLNGISAYSSLGLLKSGVGTLVLTGPNTYTGTTVADTGTLTAGAANTFPAVGTLQASGGTINTGGFNQTVATVVLSAGNVNVNAGTLTVTNGVMVNAASGAGHINLNGGTLSTPSYQTGANKTSLNWTAGTLQLTGTGAVPVSTIIAGTTLSLNPIGSNIIITGQSTGASGPAKPSVISIPVPSANYNNNRSGATIDTIVIHTTEESYAATINGFLTGSLSVNYVNNTDGSVTELVDPATGHSAFHGSQYNDRSIGIENVGFADQASTWNSSNVASLEKLVAYLAYTYNVPVLRPSDNSSYNYLQVQPPSGGTFDEPGIMAHAQFQPWNRYDPGYYFPWAQFIGDVQSLIANSITAAPLTNNGTINVTNPGGLGVTYRGDIINAGTLNITNTNFTVNGIITNSGSITLSGGALNVSGLTVNSGAAVNLQSGSASLGNLTVNNHASVTAAHGAGEVIRAQQVTVLGNKGMIDLADNKLIVTGGSVGIWDGVEYSDISGLLQSGRNGGAWNGGGIITTMSSAAGAAPLTTLAVATAGSVGKTTFGGQAVASTDVLVMYTYDGDANLDGKINADDYFQIDSNYNKTTNASKSYFNGDFNYDGKINGDDYFIIDQNFHAQGSAFSGGPALGGVSAVPEPANLTAAIAAGMFLRRRRRR